MTNTEFTKEQQQVLNALADTPPTTLPAVSESRPSLPTSVSKPKTPSKSHPGGIAHIASAIAAVTSEVGVIAKGGYNQFHRYKFAQMQDVLQRLTPLLGKHGLVIVQSETSRTFIDNGAAVAVEYEFTIGHISGEVWPDKLRQTGLCRCRDSKGGFDDKSFNKAHTAARKYFLLSLFQIATGEEDDADAHDTSTPPTPSWRSSTGPAPAATHRADTEGRLGDGTRYDARSGEIIPAANPADEKGKAGAAAPAPAELNRLDTAMAQLAEAAKHGTGILETAWYGLSHDLRKQLKSNADRAKTLAQYKELAAKAVP